MGIMNTIRNAISGRKPSRNGFPKDFTESEFISAQVTCNSGSFTRVGAYQIPAQQQYSWGYGKEGLEANQGYVYMDVRNDSNTSVDGTIRLIAENSNQIPKGYVMSRRTEILETTSNTRQDGVPLPATSLRANEDEYLAIYFDPDSDTNVGSVTNQDWQLPVTAYLQGVASAGV